MKILWKKFLEISKEHMIQEELLEDMKSLIKWFQALKISMNFILIIKANLNLKYYKIYRRKSMMSLIRIRKISFMQMLYRVRQRHIKEGPNLILKKALTHHIYSLFQEYLSQEKALWENSCRII